ncbi:hypothetical protein VPH35_113994 [Triticum aestivum]
MTSSSGEEPRTSSIVADANPMVSMEAKMLVATGHDHCQELKDMISKADPSTMVVVMASSNQTSAPKPRSPPASGDVEALRWESFLDGVTTDGDTFLHVMATNSYGENLEEDGPIRNKAVSLLFVQNNNEDTPLHCAARAGKSQMVSFLIDLARGEGEDTGRVKALLEMENVSKWTVLHEAVCSGKKDIVELLMKEDPELTSLPKTGTSPLYLAILMENKIIAKTLYGLSPRKSGINDRNLSYAGPDGQNALHAAVLRGKDLTEMLLEWNIALTIQQDENGSTPLHLAASVVRPRHRRAIYLRLLKANPDALYQMDNDGLFPIHVAALLDSTLAINDFLKESPSCVGLRDARGKTFLHLAVDKMKMRTVHFACNYRSLSWILNMQDNDGNTALHLAVQIRSLKMFCALLGNIQVNLNLTNKKGETPFDIARFKLITTKGLYSNKKSEAKILLALRLVDAKSGICRGDYFEEKKEIVEARQNGTRKLENVKEGTQSLCIGAVLIATVTFGASFAMPGGYRSDDHTGGGTPTLAGRFDFDAFMLANSLAFTFSMIATIALMSSGSPMHNPRSRELHFGMAFFFLTISITGLVAAFALGTYTMLAPVAPKTAIVVCVMSSLILLYQNCELAIKNSLLGPPIFRRKGIFRGIVWKFPVEAFTFVFVILFNLWPIVVIFCLTALSHTRGRVEPAAQPPTPLS